MAVLGADAVGSEGSPSTATELLQATYGLEFGKTGHALAGHTVIEQADVESVVQKGQGSSLLYGELLPAGVTKLSIALFHGREEVPGPVLELGMGTGKVALQIFLSLHRDVYGVELAPSRWLLADNALRKLAETVPSRFRYERLGEESSRLPDSATGRICEFACGSLLDTPLELLHRAAAIVMEVCLPKEVQRLACAMLQHCQTGCRAVGYASLHGLVDGCRLVPVRPAPAAGGAGEPEGASEVAGVLGDGIGGLALPASWKEQGHGFAFYELSESASTAQAAWSAALDSQTGTRVAVDASGCPSRARKTRYTDDVLPSPRTNYKWGKGDKVLVGYSWLPFLDLGNPGDGSAGGLDGVTWMEAQVISVNEDGFATICYQDDGTVEEMVHPERIRQENCLEKRAPIDIDWGDDAA
mmetsp:Transcript_22964/g.64527  ORF Transcript_22964/g.64527 Transcript_22964/m.64527 type:complete len:414 (+) Transcript_22964:69-1310(+)